MCASNEAGLSEILAVLLLGVFSRPEHHAVCCKAGDDHFGQLEGDGAGVTNGSVVLYSNRTVASYNILEYLLPGGAISDRDFKCQVLLAISGP